MNGTLRETKIALNNANGFMSNVYNKNVYVIA